MNQILKDALVKHIVKQALAGLIAKWAWLATGLPHMIAVNLLYKVVLWGFVETKLILIDFEKIQDRKDFDKKSEALEKAKGEKNEEQISKAESELIDSFRDFVKYR